MEIKDITQGMLNEIKEAAKKNLMMVGINAEVSVEVNTPKTHLKLKTADFQTQPVIFERVCVAGTAELEPVKGHDGVYDLIFRCGYDLLHFNGGYNGAGLGNLKFRVFDGSEHCHFVGFEIRK